MQELVFWIIFTLVASVLFVTQFLSTSSAPSPVVVEPAIQELLPDVSKTQQDAILIYENNVFSEKLNNIPAGKKIVFALGQFSGPAFDEKTVKEGALQTAYQKLIYELDEIKDNLIERLRKEFDLDFSDQLDELFRNLYRLMPSDESLVFIYKIWKKSSGEVITYYYLVVFDDEYCLTVLEVLGWELMQQLQDKGIEFREIWKEQFNNGG
ncbi:hypothetical protein [Fervidobacterium sp.]